MKKTMNTLKTFEKGFKIERNGEVITLTFEEMTEFRFLDKALSGRGCLECYDSGDAEEMSVVSKMIEDEEACYDLQNDIEDSVFSDSNAEKEEIEKAIQKYRKENVL